MTRKDRVINSLNHKESDIVPYNADFTQQEYDKIAKHLNNYHFLNQYGFHLHYGQYSGRPTPIDGSPMHYKDDFGVIWNRSGADKDIGVIDAPVINDIEDNSYIFPEPDTARFRKEIEDLLLSKEDRFAFTGIGFSMFERAWSLCGMENTLMGMLTCPKELETLLDVICEYNMQMIDIALEYDIDGFYFGDDWGQQKGLIMGAAHWRRFIKPRMKRMYGKLKSARKYVFQHSCGDISEILPDLIDIGLDCYQTVQPEIYNLKWLKSEYGNDLCFWGAISTQRLLPFASTDKVKEETRRTIDIMGRNGGYIAAPTHAVPSDVPPENILAMLDVFLNQ